MTTLEQIKIKLREFTKDRDWDQFHSPKNLVMALTSEIGELTEHFQWLTENQSNNLSNETLTKVQEEIADIQIYLIRLTDRLQIDILKAVTDKIEKNSQKYPADKVRGSAQKYTAYTNSETKSS